MSREEVGLLGAALDTWDTVYEQCPFCGREAKMGITRNPEGLLYNCFSTACAAKGFIPDVGKTGKRSPPPKPRRFVGELSPLSEADIRYFDKRFQIVPPTWWRVTGRGDYYFPVFAKDYRQVGEVIRKPSWSGDPQPPRTSSGSGPKAMTYLEPGGKKYSYAAPSFDLQARNERAVVLVEDHVSAERVAQLSGLQAIALLGCTIPDGLIAELLGSGIQSVMIWLDPDMSENAFNINADIGNMFPHCKVIMSDEDPKDVPLDKLKEELYD